MKQFFKFFFTSKATILLLIILSVALAFATFIEDKYDTVTSKILIYNAFWVELIFVLLIINLIGHIKKFNLFSRKKIGGLMFHLAFVVMIIGAGITRYFGFEGSIHIRKGEASNIVYSSEPYLMISYAENKDTLNYEFPISIGVVTKNSFKVNIPTEGKGNIEVEYRQLFSNAVSVLEENVKDGIDMIELITLSEKGREETLIKNGETIKLGQLSLSFNSNQNNSDVEIFNKDGQLNIRSPFEIVQTSMKENSVDTIEKDSVSVFAEKSIYSINEEEFVFSKFYKSAQTKLAQARTPGTGVNAIILDVTIKGKKYQANVFNSPKFIVEYERFNFDGTIINFRFGNKFHELPFSLYLKDFIFERYPGSDRPSSYRSDVILIDEGSNLREDHSIFMNNVLDYNKYRFFQSSYDRDEQGTILSVSYDFWGTLVSYTGYFLLIIGFIITLINKNSRFLTLRKLITTARNNRKSTILTIITFIGFSTFLSAQNPTSKVVEPNHAKKFGRLLIQTFDGRFAPVHTLTLDLIHKISKKDRFNIEGKGKMNAIQVFIDMIVFPEFWQKQDIIYVPQQSIRDIIGCDTKYASFYDFFDENSEYKLGKYISTSFRKSEQEKNKFDKEILKVDERLNIFYMILDGSIVKIFPEIGSDNNKWISWNDPASLVPLTGDITIINNELKLKKFNYIGIMRAYFTAVLEAIETGDYTQADKIVGYISDVQKNYSDLSLLPSETKISAEIFYNNANIFNFLKNIYAIFSLLLLIFAFIDNISAKKNKFVVFILNFSTIPLIIAFLIHTVGMGLRWYITNHAPWANGYEALILVAWGSLFAGFLFAKHSKLTLAGTALLSFLVLMTAGHSSYDPQLTNLQPVLKSYWLIFHVATLTISYGFFGLGFILGLMNLIIFLFKSEKNYIRLDLLIDENSYIIEMNLIIGLVLATIGTFLGAIWANESWGRYWGWDAKETWALIIIITYTIILHLRLIPKLNTKYIFNVASVLGFGSVLMTFIGVNYYLSKGMHSYGAGDTPVFPLLTWIIIIGILFLILFAYFKNKNDSQIDETL